MLGSAESVTAQGMQLPADVPMDGRAVWIAVDGEIAGAVVIQDELTDSAQGLADALRGLGAQSVVLATGDNDEAEARRVARRIGADRCQWGLKPEDKVGLVSELTGLGTTVMVGDGVNDALSLSRADVGISIGSAKGRSGHQIFGYRHHAGGCIEPGGRCPGRQAADSCHPAELRLGHRLQSGGNCTGHGRGIESLAGGVVSPCQLHSRGGQFGPAGEDACEP